MGKLKRDSPEARVFHKFAARCRFDLRVDEINEGAGEAAAIARRLSATAKIIALDERGQDLSSPELAQVLRDAQDAQRLPTFLIGGADGLDPSLRGRADILLRFGRVVWPHQLIRGMLAEQIYRAQTILDGHPYHRR